MFLRFEGFWYRNILKCDSFLFKREQSKSGNPEKAGEMASLGNVKYDVRITTY